MTSKHSYTITENINVFINKLNLKSSTIQTNEWEFSSFCDFISWLFNQLLIKKTVQQFQGGIRSPRPLSPP